MTECIINYEGPLLFISLSYWSFEFVCYLSFVICYFSGEAYLAKA